MGLFDDEIEWHTILKQEEEKSYFQHLKTIVDRKRSQGIVYPPRDAVFRAFLETPLQDVKVVILGQDPYHNGNADGLAFSCKNTLSPSLEKIFAEIPIGKYGQRTKITLDDWAHQGVLLLNTVLTVDASKAHSHAEIGWEKYTGECIRTIYNRDVWIAWLLWGKPAQEQFDRATGIVPKSNMLVIRSEHPAYAAYQKRRWQNDNCFAKVNEFLSFHNQEPIKWA